MKTFQNWPLSLSRIFQCRHFVASCLLFAGEQLQFTAKLNFVTASKGMKKEFGHKSRMDGVQASPNNVKHATRITI